MDGPLWESNSRMALALAASMPVGDPEIVELRLVIDEFLNGDAPAVVMPAAWTTPLYNAATLARPWPANYIYVGHGPIGSGFNSSPWGSPFAVSLLSAGCPYDSRFIPYARNRADIVYWLRPLVGKCLVCHCGEKIAMQRI